MNLFRNTFRTTALCVPVLVAAMSLAACGTSEDPPDGNGDGGAADSEGTDGDGSNRADGSDTDDADGADAPRVIALEWSIAEDLVALGVMPVGVADLEGYDTWLIAAPLDDDVTDVGTRQEPSVDAIVALEPDLVITGSDRGPALVQQLEEYVPVLALDTSDASGELPLGNVEKMKENVELIAEEIGREDEAAAVLAEFDAAIEAGAEAVRDAGAEGREFAIADGWLEGGSVAIRMFAEHSLMSDLAEGIGLDNAWTEPGDEAWGLAQTDVEGLLPLRDSPGADGIQFFYSASGPEDVFADELSGNRIWDSLPFVEGDRVIKLEPGTWTFGGPLSSRHVIDQYVDAVTS